MANKEKLFSLENEIAVISILLRNPDLYYSTRLRFFMFSVLSHQLIFQEMESLADRQVAADSRLLASSLDSSGNLSKIGGKEYLDHLVSQEFDKDNLKVYSKLVMDAYKGRALLSAASQIKEGDLSSDNVDDSIRDFRKSLDDLVDFSGGVGTVHIGDNIKKAFDDIISRTSNPGIRGFSWGQHSIDVTTGGKSPGDYWIIGGRPSQGKTALICNSILTDGRNGVPSLVFEKEMNYQTMVERLVAIDTGVSLTNIRMGILNKEQVGQIAESTSRIRTYPIYLDTSFTSDVHYVESTISKFKVLKNVQTVYIDYLQLLAERSENQTQELGAISRMLRLISLDNNICMIALSQLNRLVELRENKRPILSDLRQSGNLEEDADFVVGLYRDEYYNKETKFKNFLEFIILKARNGPVGTVSLKFQPESNQVTQA